MRFGNWNNLRTHNILKCLRLNIPKSMTPDTSYWMLDGALNMLLSHEKICLFSDNGDHPKLLENEEMASLNFFLR